MEAAFANTVGFTSGKVLRERPQVVRGILAAQAKAVRYLMANRHEMLGNDVQARMRHQVMNVRHPARHRVLDRDHAEFRFARGDRGQRVLESRAGQGLRVGISLGDRDMGVGARLALERDFHCLGHAAF